MLMVAATSYAQNVGIGIAAPLTTLHVKSSGSSSGYLTIDNSSSTVQSGIYLSSSGTTKANMYYDPTATTYNANGSVYINNLSTTSPNTLINASGTGNVGIGYATPQQVFSVQCAAGVYSNAEHNAHAISALTGTTTSDYILYMGADKTNGLSYIQSVHYGVAIANLVLNARGGNVGIGTATPNNALEVQGAGNSSGLRFTNLLSTAKPTVTYKYGKDLTVNSTGDVVIQNPIMPESRYLTCARWFPLINSSSLQTSNSVYTLPLVCPGTDDYGLPFPTSSTVSGTPFPYPQASGGAQPSSYYINPWYGSFDDNAYMQHGTTYFLLIYDFYIVYPASGTYTFTLGATDDYAALYLSPANDINPADMTSKATNAYQTPTGYTLSPTYTTASLAAGDVMRARVYYMQGTGGHSFSMSVSGGSTNLMSMCYSVK